MDDLFCKIPEQTQRKSEINFQADNGWIMKITKGKIIFNREEFPDLCEDEFAYGVLKILEKAKVIEIDESQWVKGRIIIEK